MAADTRPKPCDHCQFCEFELVCDAQWRAADSLVHVAGVRTADRLVLQQDGVRTIAALGELDREVAAIDPARQETMVRQARLQVQARNAPDAKPPFELLSWFPAPGSPGTTNPEPIGFAAMPAPDDGDVFLDFEGHPFWHADSELFFLFGLIERTPAGEWEFKKFWAHDKAEEATATKALVDHLAARRAQFPNMHVYHYNHTERTSLQRLVTEHGVAELALEQLLTTGDVLVDLLPIVKGAMQVGVEGYGLEAHRAPHRLRAWSRDRSGRRRGRGDQRWMASNDQASLTMIADYNEDDVRATRAFARLVGDATSRRRDVASSGARARRARRRTRRAHRSAARVGPGTAEHLLGDLLGYWRRSVGRSAPMCTACRLPTRSISSTRCRRSHGSRSRARRIR